MTESGEDKCEFAELLKQDRLEFERRIGSSKKSSEEPSQPSRSLRHKPQVEKT